MANEKPESKDSSLSDDELEKAVGGTAKSTGAAGEGAVGTVLKKKRDAREYQEETGSTR